MTSAKAPIVTSASVEVYFTSTLRWLSELFGAIVRFGWRGRSRRLHRILCRAERAVEGLLFLKAVALYAPATTRHRIPRFAPRGFSLLASKGRLFFRSARVRAKKANTLDRVMALIEALMHPTRVVNHFLKRICRGLILSHLAPSAPPSDAIARALLCVHQLIDTS